MDNIGIGLQLMAVGMVTVFSILLIVIYGSRLLIEIVNRFAPEEVVDHRKKAAATVQKSPTPAMPGTEAIDTATMHILQQAVAQITKGRGRITQAQRL